MNTLLRRTLATAGLLSVVTLYAGVANAGCPFAAAATLEKQSWHGAEAVRMRPVEFRGEDREDIVGFWNTTFTLRGNVGIPDGVADKGLQQWHSDGTEFLSSSKQVPLTGNYCQGAWKKIGPSSYALNHFAYNYDTNQNLSGLVNIREQVVVNREGTVFNGVFTIQQYDNLRNKVGPQVKGIVQGKRIDVDTSAQDIL